MLIFGTRVNGPISTTALINPGSRAAAMVAAPPENDWPTRTAGPPRWRMSCQQIAGGIGAGVRGPARARLPVSAQVDVRHPVTRGHQLRGQEAVGVTAVAHPVGQHDQRASTGHVVGDPPARDVHELGHFSSSYVE